MIFDVRSKELQEYSDFFEDIINLFINCKGIYLSISRRSRIEGVLRTAPFVLNYSVMPI